MYIELSRMHIFTKVSKVIFLLSPLYYRSVESSNIFRRQLKWDWNKFYLACNESSAIAWLGMRLNDTYWTKTREKINEIDLRGSRARLRNQRCYFFSLLGTRSLFIIFLSIDICFLQATATWGRIDTFIFTKRKMSIERKLNIATKAFLKVAKLFTLE